MQLETRNPNTRKGAARPVLHIPPSDFELVSDFGFRISGLLKVSLLAAVLLLPRPPLASAAGVTVVTHGFGGNVTQWVIPMINKMAQYHTFPGTNCSLFQISVTRTNGVYFLTSSFLDGGSPLTSDSGEILIALDWSTLSTDGT